jgi:hypothetical protein
MRGFGLNIFVSIGAVGFDVLFGREAAGVLADHPELSAPAVSQEVTRIGKTGQTTLGDKLTLNLDGGIHVYTVKGYGGEELILGASLDEASNARLQEERRIVAMGVSGLIGAGIAFPADERYLTLGFIVGDNDPEALDAYCDSFESEGNLPAAVDAHAVRVHDATITVR